METLVLDGKTYVKASKAALDLGYTADYVGQLCRGGSVDAHLVGRTWYVNPNQLGEHRVEKKRTSRTKAREQARKSIEEHKLLRSAKTTNSYNNIAIRYEKDSEDLIPNVRKLNAVNESKSGIQTRETVSEEEEQEPYEIENKGMKIAMSGKLRIQDASAEYVDEDTTVLSPKILRKAAVQRNVGTEKKLAVAAEDSEESLQDKSRVPANFLTRLQNEEDASTTPEVQPVDEQQLFLESLHSDARQPATSRGWYMAVLACVLILSIMSCFLQSQFAYTAQQKGTEATFTSTISFDIEGTLSKVRKI